MGDPAPPVTLVGDDASGYIVSGIVTTVLIVFVVSAVVGIVARFFGRRGSWVVAVPLGVLGFIAGPVGILTVASLTGGFAFGNVAAARRRGW
ncbi:MAG TPA: hypothetical protein VLR27_09240 [Acidimicrobiales bacterium]|nr:hypothetical protein [Acidimicrobiales bacterium]